MVKFFYGRGLFIGFVVIVVFGFIGEVQVVCIFNVVVVFLGLDKIIGCVIIFDVYFNEIV